MGRVFDAYLGSAVVSCSLGGLVPGAAAAAAAAAAVADAGAEPAVTPPPLALSQYAMDLSEYSGLVVRLIGDGQRYTLIVRTSEHAGSGLEYHGDFTSPKTKFGSVRLPFSTLAPMRSGKRVADAPELNRSLVTGIAFGYYPHRNLKLNPQTTGDFYLSVNHIKVYRKRDEPEFVYISDGTVASLHAGQKPAGKAAGKAGAGARLAVGPATAGLFGGEGRRASDVARWARGEAKARGEEMLRSSGLTYFIVRPAQLDDSTRGGAPRRLAFTQDNTLAGSSISRADVAEVTVRFR